MTAWTTCRAICSRSASVVISSACCGADHDRRDALRPVVLVLDRDLGLTVRPQGRHDPALPHLGEPARQPVGQHDREGHELLRLAAGVAEHHPLVPRAPRVHALGDVGRLLVDGGDDGAGLVIEPVAGVVVPDLRDRPPGHLLEVHVGGGRDLPRDEAQPRGQERLAGDATHRVLPEDLVQHGVRDLVGDLVRVALGHGLRGEEVLSLSRHGALNLSEKRAILTGARGRGQFGPRAQPGGPLRALLRLRHAARRSPEEGESGAGPAR